MAEDVELVPDPDASPTGERLSYVAGLDGVRALAVVAVIAYHAGVTHVTGGFLGVDVFFSLSGFLITSLLLGEARHTGTIHLGAFWARRARRLLPALLLVLCFVGLLSWLAATPGTYQGLRLDSLSTLLYVANWHFILEGSSYFKAAVAQSPLTHTWSLAIEEQFYVLWPLVVLALVKLRKSPVALLVVSVLGAIGSTALMAIRFSPTPGLDQTRLYYGTDTHAMTLLTGAALAAALALIARRNDPSTLRATGRWGLGVQLAGLAGIVGLGAMAFKVRGDTPWLYDRGGFLLCGIATAAVILSAVTTPGGVLARLLALAPVRFVGRISYGLYLWHYPIFIWLDHERTGLFGVKLLVLRLAVTVAVATASFYLVERPVRHGVALRGASAALATALAVATTVAVVFATSLAAAVPSPSASTPPQPAFHNPVRALLIGDSTMLTLGIAIAPWAHLYDVNELDAGDLGCGVTFSNFQIEHGATVPTALPCSLSPGQPRVSIYASWQHDVATFHPDAVAVLAGRWEVHNLKVGGRIVNITQHSFQEAVAAGLTRAVEIAGSRGARVVLVTQPCSSSGERDNGQLWPEDSLRRVAIYNGILRAVAHRTGTSVLDLYSMVCPGGRYQASIDGVVVRNPDGVHFAVSSGSFFAPRIFSVLIAAGRTRQGLKVPAPRT